MFAVTIFCCLSLLLILGKILRVYLPILQRLYLPSSVIGGFIGLLIVQYLGEHIPAEYVTAVRKVPGILISIIFSTLFLGVATPKLKQIWNTALPQLCLGQISSWGQYVIGLGLAGFVFVPLFKMSPMFGNLLEIGFQGGHGTVGGMTATFEGYNWSDGVALGYTIATFGMLAGIIIGMILVNWALRKGHINQVRTFDERSYEEKIGIYPAKKSLAAGHQTTMCDSLDSLAWHLALIGLACLLGIAMLKTFQFAEVKLLPKAGTRIFNGFPLFPLCMIGGVIVQKIFTRLKREHMISHGQMSRIAGASLDFLVVSAISTIQLSVVLDNWLPLLILASSGIVWCVLLVIFVAPKLFKTAWFEKAIADFGQSTGVTATGLLLLRTVDPENKTDAASSFGYKQLIHEPFMGGGFWTAAAVSLVMTFGWFKIWLVSIACLTVWSIIAWRIAKR